MIVLTFYEFGELVEDLPSDTVNEDGAQTLCRAYCDRPGRSAHYEGTRESGGVRGGYWHDGTSPVFTQCAGPARTERGKV